ncbi:MAG: T9SS type A sorting domain-containing protein, partial [Bacteroidales bacterium]|nr:T9SS type A sorting domain-containing protein [Bacteroidales bacterium]
HTQVFDTLWTNDTVWHNDTIWTLDTLTVLDTTWTHLFDTIPVLDTTTIYIYDTIHIIDTIHVYDTTHVSIQGAEAVPWKIGQSGLNIIVSGAEGETVRVYDVSGRCLHVQPRAVGVLRFRMPTAGVYLVQVGGSPAQRVVITDVGS